MSALFFLDVAAYSASDKACLAFFGRYLSPVAFFPCVDGLSHNEAEEISQEWAAASTNVLYHAVVETAGLVDE